MRDDRWLLSRLDYLWSEYFSDIAQINPVFIQFGRHSRLRLGSIKFDPRSGHSFITITSMFKDPEVPVEVVDHTIAHELSHYTHGFSSPHERAHKHPHRGGVVDKEMAERGLQHLSKAYKEWLKSYRVQLIAEAPARRRRRRRLVRFKWV